ncbi:MAG TPA: FlgD immunoglobulin-like domain containing protein [Candidatus Saccharimonadales bacterium]|nr:FlgD immunoglobulin-like domain containing protein [Candidatus Saccharimonadales bacterium]
MKGNGATFGLIAATLAALGASALAPRAARADWWATSTWQYQKHPWGPRGLEGAVVNAAIRRARVEVCDARTDSILAQGATDEGGRAVIWVHDTQVRDVYERVYAATSDTALDSVGVCNGGSGPPLCVVTPVLHSHLPYEDFSIPATGLVQIGKGAEEFHIFDALLQGAEYAAWAGRGRAHVALRAYCLGTAYSRPSVETDTLGFSLLLGSQTAWDDLWLQGCAGTAALWWEAGAGVRSLKGGPGALSWTAGRWMGGWGVYTALATQRWLGADNTGWYVVLPTARGATAAAVSMNMDRPGVAFHGAEDTLAVARMLWSLTGGSNRNVVPAGAAAGEAPLPDTAVWSLARRAMVRFGSSTGSARFWLSALGAFPQYGRTLDAAFRDAGFEYFPDPEEPDDSASAAPWIQPDSLPTHHTFFDTLRAASGTLGMPRDPDWTRFHGEACRGYLIEARRPGDGNGANLTVLASGSQVALATAHGSVGHDPSASLLFAPESSGTYLINCAQSYSSSDFGHYDLVVNTCGPVPVVEPLAGSAPARFRAGEGLVWGEDGWFYGVSPYHPSADTAAMGCLFRTDPSGNVEIVADYPAGHGVPSGLVRGEDGYFYGLSDPLDSYDGQGATLPAEPDRTRRSSRMRLAPRATGASDERSPATLFRVDRQGHWSLLKAFYEQGVPSGDTTSTYSYWSDLELAPAPGGGVYLALGEYRYTMSGSASSVDTVTVCRSDSAGNLSLVSGLADADLSTRLVPEPGGGVYFGLENSDDSTRNGLFHMSATGEVRQELLLPQAHGHPYVCAAQVSAAGVVYVLTEASDRSQLLRISPSGVTTELFEIPRAVGYVDVPWLYRGRDSRFYGAFYLRSSDLFTAGEQTLVADTSGNFAVIPCPTTSTSWPLGFAEGPDTCLYGVSEYTLGFFRICSVVGRPLGAVTQCTATATPAGVELQWRPILYASLHYRIERAESGGAYQVRASLDTASTQILAWRDSTAIAGRAYRYRLAYRFGDAPWSYASETTAQTRTPVLRLALPAPNPSRVTTRLSFEVPSRGRVRVEVFNVAGARVRTLLDAALAPGPGSVTWDGSDARGQLVPSGLYFVRLSAAGQTAARKVLRLR